ncbi:MAG: cyclase family protein [Bacteroidia bacterium]|nr:cyclase family protein [Bacteroidia bacterium]
MIATLFHKGKEFRVDFYQPLDISIPVRKEGNVVCWYQDEPKITPVMMGDFVGEVKSGAPVNFRNIFFNPHAHVTHTESVGHITPEWISVYREQKIFFYISELITVLPEELSNGDRVISKAIMEASFEGNLQPEALIIRTLDNSPEKISAHYSNTNPPYLQPDAMKFIVEKGIRHLLIDLPSVDREQDEGKLTAHRIFWDYPDNPRMDCTITELVYVPNHIPDGNYLLNLIPGPFDNDASPSRPILYKIF